jgi:hypothetical protein
MPSVLDPHLDQAPGLGRGCPDDRNSGLSRPGVLAAAIPYLDPDHHRALGRTGRVPGDFGESRGEEEHHPGIIRQGSGMLRECPRLS